MFDQNRPSTQNLNRAEYLDKVLGCWTGKNIGGTLGTPMEGKRDVFNVTFYTQDQKGVPAPNDDLDLQLVWLQAVEEHGAEHITERLLGEYWMGHIIGPWNEYGVGKVNISNGLVPPLSGAVNNDQWKNSNGAWIRSEVWACMFPGSPDEAASYAWMDACVDHADDGIYAELFTASVEAAAFVESDIRKLIEIGLTKIPADCRVARSVKLACSEYDAKHDFVDARNAIVKENEDLGWFQAPDNIGFTILGLLYGEGDFGKTVCAAVNCGDDTDCTGATAGAILGIIKGRSGIPKEWIEPIGETIKTVAINPFKLDVPKTLQELTDRVARVAFETWVRNPTLIPISDAPTAIDDAYRAKLLSSGAVAKRLWQRSSMILRYPLPYGCFNIQYVDGPIAKPGEPLRIKLWLNRLVLDDKSVHCRWELPEGWTAEPGCEVAMLAHHGNEVVKEVILIPGEFGGAYEYVLLEITLAGRFNPEYITVPFQLTGCVQNDHRQNTQDHWDARNRLSARRASRPL